MKKRIQIESEDFEIVKLPFNCVTTVKINDLAEADIHSLLDQVGMDVVKEWLKLEDV